VTFKDVKASAWYAEEVGFIAARGITSGTGDGKYRPEEGLTRGQFAVMILRAYGVSPVKNPADNFTDAGNTYYTGYLAAAKRLGISKGTGNNRFEPDKKISRQEMFTLIYNTLKVIDRLPESTNGKAPASFSDGDKVAAWAKDAVTVLLKAGIVNGSNGRLDLTEELNRAQMAQVLYNLLSK